jgi:hypothetical protein
LQRPVGGATGLWCLLGMFILIGPIIWFVKYQQRAERLLAVAWRPLTH